MAAIDVGRTRQVTTVGKLSRQRSSGVRVAVALILQAGFHLLGLVMLVALLVATVAAASWAPQGIPVLVMLTGAVGLTLWRGLAATARGERPEDPAGVAVGRADQPSLWRLVDEVAEAVGTRAPERLILVPGANAAVWERTRFGGLVGGPRTMEMGLCLLQVLGPDELRAVVAHELGHLSGGDTRFGPVVYRGMLAMRAALDGLDDAGFGVVFHGYGRLYLRQVQRICREQERSADRRAAVATSAASLARALATVQAASAAWDALIEDYALPAWRSGRHPEDLFDWYTAIWWSEARRQELVQVLARADAPDPYDSHPPLAERLAALAVTSLDESDVLGPRCPAAIELVLDPPAVTRWVAAALTAHATGRNLPPVATPDFGSAVTAPVAVERAAELLRLLPLLIPPFPATPAGLVEALAAGHSDDLLAFYVPGVRARPRPVRQEAARQLLVPAVASVAALTLARPDGPRWHFSPALSMLLVDQAGREVPVLAWAADAVVSPEGAVELRRHLLVEGADLSPNHPFPGAGADPRR